MQPAPNTRSARTCIKTRRFFISLGVGMQQGECRESRCADISESWYLSDNHYVRNMGKTAKFSLVDMQRVLIVEDDPGMNDYIRDILAQKGFEVSSAFDGFAGMDAIRSSPPTVVILDIFMPEKDGLEMLVELRRFTKSLPVLVISGKQHLLSGCSMSLAKQLGATDVLSKPFTPKALIERVVALANHSDKRHRESPLPDPHRNPSGAN